MWHRHLFFRCAVRRAPLASIVPVMISITLASSRCTTEPSDSAPAEETSRGPGESAPSIEEEKALVFGTAPPATGGFPSVVLLEPRTARDFPVPSAPALMDQFGTAFHPRLLLVRAGQPVDFRNSEGLSHNVHVVERETGASVFNVETPTFGSYRYIFERNGVYDLSCDIHPAMTALVFVTSTPYAVVADKTGKFSLSGAPAGSYRLRVWNLDPARRIERRGRDRGTQNRAHPRTDPVGILSCFRGSG